MHRVRRRGHAPFLAASASAGFVLAAAAGGYALAGHALLRRQYAEVSPPWMERILERADGLVAAALAVGLYAWACCALLYLWKRTGGGRGRAVLGLAGLYLALELLVAPFLAAPLGLEDFYFVRDPDHWPGSGPGSRYYREWGGMNGDWVRSPFERGDFRPEHLNLVFLGDSFTYGFDVAAGDAFPARVGELLAERFPAAEVRVANFGWVSSSPLLSLRRLEHLGPAYHPDLVVLCVDMTDFHDEILWRNMLQRKGIYWCYDRLPIALGLFRAWFPGAFERLHRATLGDPPAERFFAGEWPLERSRPHLTPLVESLEQLDALCAERGWGFAVFVLPRAYQYSDRECPRNWERDEYTVLGPHALEPFRFFEELAGRVDYPVHSLLGDFRASREFPLYFEHDPHWNEAGHGVAARAIADRLGPLVAPGVEARPAAGR